MRGQKVADLRDMHPRQQCRVAGGIRAAIEASARDLLVNGAHLVDQPVGVCRRAKRGAGNELPGATQPPQHVLSEIGVIPYPGKRQRVQGLQHQSADAANQHAGEITMHLPTDGIGAKQAGIAFGVFEVELAE